MIVPDIPEVVPVTTPAGDTLMEGSLLDHVPPGVAFASVVVSPVHIAVGPVMIAGKGFTVTTWVTAGQAGTV